MNDTKTPEPELSDRQRRILAAVLNYGSANTDDINEAYASPGGADNTIRVEGAVIAPIADGEIKELAAAFDVALFYFP